jgi:L-methionine (R)-S-oxide reductase
MTKTDRLEQWLKEYLAQHHATAGTLHVAESGGLRLVAQCNIPTQVQQLVEWVPNGKGMAGLALQRKQPVQTCNLQEDQSGDVKPGARAVSAKAAVALPIMDDSGEVYAVVGLAFDDEREFESTDLRAFSDSAETVPELKFLRSRRAGRG